MFFFINFIHETYPIEAHFSHGLAMQAVVSYQESINQLRVSQLDQLSSRVRNGYTFAANETFLNGGGWGVWWVVGLVDGWIKYKQD